jgi:hypothetical protein
LGLDPSSKEIGMGGNGTAAWLYTGQSQHQGHYLVHGEHGFTG